MLGGCCSNQHLKDKKGKHQYLGLKLGVSEFTYFSIRTYFQPKNEWQGFMKSLQVGFSKI